MHINDLPDDVLRTVLQAALPVFEHQPTCFTDGQILLSVCRRWRGIALPVVFHTASIECCTRDESADNRPKSADITTTLDQTVNAKCLHMVRRLVIDVDYEYDPFPGLKAVIERMHATIGVLPGVCKLEVCMHADDWDTDEFDFRGVDCEGDIDSVSSGLASLLPGLQDIRFEYDCQTQATSTLFGRLAGLYANQLQVLHSRHELVVPQDQLFTRLRDVRVGGFLSNVLDFQLPRLNPEVIEKLELVGFAAKNVWSMFCADPNGHAITFPRLTNLSLEYRKRSEMSTEQLSTERPWALQFPAAKRVRVVCNDTECPSMENAVFPTHLESLDIRGGLGLYRAIANANVRVSQKLDLVAKYRSAEANVELETINRIFAAAGHCKSRKMTIISEDAIPLQLFTYTSLMHLQLCGPTSVDDVLEHINRQPHLVSLATTSLRLNDIHDRFWILPCEEHDPVAPLDTQIRELNIRVGYGPQWPKLALPVLYYLILRIPTLRNLTIGMVPQQSIRNFIDKYAQWYPHLANIKFGL